MDVNLFDKVHVASSYREPYTVQVFFNFSARMTFILCMLGKFWRVTTSFFKKMEIFFKSCDEKLRPICPVYFFRILDKLNGIKHRRLVFINALRLFVCLIAWSYF